VVKLTEARKRFVVALGKSIPDIEPLIMKSWNREFGDTSRIRSLLFDANIDGIKNTRRGIFVDVGKEEATNEATAVLQLLSVAFSSSRFRMLRTNAERLSVVEQLNGLGYRVAVINYPELIEGNLIERARPFAKILRGTMQVQDKIGGKKLYESSSLWTRDLWQNFAGTRVKRFVDGKTNPAGEGGAIVPINASATIMNKRLCKEPVIKTLAKSGRKFYFLNDGMEFKGNLSKMFSADIYFSNDHIDLFIGVAGNVLLVDPLYFKQNAVQITALAYENSLKVLAVPAEEARTYPSNFLVLGDNRLIINKAAPKTLELLRCNGVDAIPTNVPLHANLMAGGGIRCFTNEL